MQGKLQEFERSVQVKRSGLGIQIYLLGRKLLPQLELWEQREMVWL
jgi:hypothetical protein